MSQALDFSLVSRSSKIETPVLRNDACRLRQKFQQEDMQTIVQSIGSAVRQIGILAAPLAPMKHAQRCEALGHVMPASGWHAGIVPLCVDCGKKICSPTEIRDSVWKVW